MPPILPLRPDITEYLNDHGLSKKWTKVKNLFENNIRHPSLNVEILEPRDLHIYSFRIDKKYRVLFVVHQSGEVEVFKVTNHYK